MTSTELDSIFKHTDKVKDEYLFADEFVGNEICDEEMDRLCSDGGEEEVDCGVLECNADEIEAREDDDDDENNSN